MGSQWLFCFIFRTNSKVIVGMIQVQLMELVQGGWKASGSMNTGPLARWCLPMLSSEADVRRSYQILLETGLGRLRLITCQSPPMRTLLHIRQRATWIATLSLSEHAPFSLRSGSGTGDQNKPIPSQISRTHVRMQRSPCQGMNRDTALFCSSQHVGLSLAKALLVNRATNWRQAPSGPKRPALWCRVACSHSHPKPGAWRIQSALSFLEAVYHT
jgi:hypothetical protein